MRFLTLFSLALLIFLLPALAFAQSCSVWFDQNPINQGGGTTLHWGVDLSGGFSLFPSLYINNIGYVGIFCARTSGDGKCQSSPPSGDIWVAPGGTTDYSGTLTAMGGRKDVTVVLATCPATLTVNADPCPSYIDTPWQSIGLLLYSGATRKITQHGYNNCVTNNSGNHYFIPAGSGGELQSFFNAAGSLGVSVF